MNILILNGSPRPKGNTRRMIVSFVAGAENGAHAKLRELEDFGCSLK